ncbi:hypothetical protein PR202_gb00541 [Eleusine coracana subsp. coracana]|uniref:Uncharacterized protein n=1 Tax=Eleusine coracana subsp. coracana TaxID=191504 RepID=A0AAV5DV39_ELECO|nr:hypothetical protein PR202_gb00541 [Eleusine coracana subsp. coracana]
MRHEPDRSAGWIEPECGSASLVCARSSSLLHLFPCPPLSLLPSSPHHFPSPRRRRRRRHRVASPDADSSEPGTTPFHLNASPPRTRRRPGNERDRRASSSPNAQIRIGPRICAERRLPLHGPRRRFGLMVAIRRAEEGSPGQRTR